jgi:hypothetical protein
LPGEEGVRKEDEVALKEVWEALKTIGRKAKENG